MGKPKKSTKLWVARDYSSALYLYNGKPSKRTNLNSHIWCSSIAGAMKLDPELFPDVKWEDKEPTQVTIRM